MKWSKSYLSLLLEEKKEASKAKSLLSSPKKLPREDGYPLVSKKSCKWNLRFSTCPWWHYVMHVLRDSYFIKIGIFCKIHVSHVIIWRNMVNAHLNSWYGLIKLNEYTLYISVFLPHIVVLSFLLMREDESLLRKYEFLLFGSFNIGPLLRCDGVPRKYYSYVPMSCNTLPKSWMFMKTILYGKNWNFVK